MKRLMVLILAVVFCLPLAVYAASIGGAETQGKGKIAVGFDSSFIFGRDLKFKGASGLAADTEIKDMKVKMGYEELSKISYGLFDWLDVYARLGAAQYDTKDNIYTSGVQTYSGKGSGDWGFAWGVGLKASHPIKDNWLLGVDLQYSMSNSESKVTNTATATGIATSTTYKSNTAYEWHVAPFVGYKLGNFVPYLGVRYSDFRAKSKKPADDGWTDNNKSEADDNVGIFIGTDYKIGDHWKLNIEGRFVDEAALSVGATYRF